jgi:hypothetical protein
MKTVFNSQDLYSISEKENYKFLIVLINDMLTWVGFQKKMSCKIKQTFQ